MSPPTGYWPRTVDKFLPEFYSPLHTDVIPFGLVPQETAPNRRPDPKFVALLDVLG
jgi:hypothetical protein